MADVVRHFSTLDLAPTASVAVFRSFLCEVYFDLDVRAHEEAVRASIIETSFGAASVTRVTSNATKVVRLKEKTRRDDVGFHVMLLPLAGSLAFGQRSREGVVGPGGAVLLHSTEPYEVASPGYTDHLCLRLPCNLLSRRLSGVDDLCASDALTSHPMAPLLAQFVTGTLHAAGRAPLPARVEALCVDLVTLILDPVAPEHTTVEVAKAAKFFSYLDGHFASLDLTLGSAARACGMSSRSLQRLLRRHDTSFGHELRARRLCEADRLLRASSSGTYSIGEIAFNSGFKSQAHFATAYRESYGVSPRQVRAEPEDRSSARGQ